MNITCKNCGGDVTTISESGNTVKVKCTCCGSVFEHTTAPTPTPRRESVSPEMAAEDIYDRNIRAVAEITTEAGRASGYVISGSGVIVTNTHAVTKNGGAPCVNITVKVGNRVYGAKIIALGDNNGGHGNGVDLALLIAEGGSFEYVELGSSANVRNGESVYYIGNSQGEGTCITGGIVSDRDRIMDGKRYIMTDAATNPGNSGCPLINKNGEVIGTHVSARTGAVGMKYAIPVDTVKTFIATVAQKSGLSTRDMCDSYFSAYSDSGMASYITLINEGVTKIGRIRR